MSMPFSKELRCLIEEAFDLADRQRREINSLHLFLASMMTTNPGMTLLKSMGYSEDDFLPFVSAKLVEEPSLAEDVLDEAERVAKSHGSPAVDSLHMLLGIVERKQSLAYRLLERAGVPLQDFSSNLCADIHTRVLFQ